MIAQVVFDLPVDGPFDYLVPASLEKQVALGMRVDVLLGFKKCVGIITGLIDKSAFDQLKPIKSLLDQKSLLDKDQIALAQDFSRYYGCSLGEALFTMIRGNINEELAAAIVRKGPSSLTLHIAADGNYEAVLIALIKPWAVQHRRVLILVPDQFATSTTEGILQRSFSTKDYVIGTRSMVFRSLKDIALVIMLDEDDASYKQEQSPMYETRQVLLMRLSREPVDIAFISTTPSVELMAHATQEKFQIKTYPAHISIKPQLVDLNNYNVLWRGICSPAVLSALESNISKGLKSILVLNRRGSYAMTRCTDCGFVLKCPRCDSPVMYSRIKKQYLCRHCSFEVAAASICPSCKKPSLKSFGLGVEQLQKGLKEKFPMAQVHAFERGDAAELGNYDILVGTRALLRFKHKAKASLVALLDIDSELNRLDMRSCFHAFSLMGHFKGMAERQVLIQSRQVDHYVLQAILKDDIDLFYREDLRLRRELAFCPFGHQVMICLRSLQQPLVEKKSQEFYEALVKQRPEGMTIATPTIEGIAKKRDKWRVNILVQGTSVVAMIAFINGVMRGLKRSAKVITTVNVD